MLSLEMFAEYRRNKCFLQILSCWQAQLKVELPLSKLLVWMDKKILNLETLIDKPKNTILKNICATSKDSGQALFQIRIFTGFHQGWKSLIKTKKSLTFKETNNYYIEGQDSKIQNGFMVSLYTLVKIRRLCSILSLLRRNCLKYK